MNRYRLAVLIILGLAALALFWDNLFPEMIIRDYYLLCPDGTIVGCYPYFCRNRTMMECEGRVCKPQELPHWGPCPPLNYYTQFRQ